MRPFFFWKMSKYDAWIPNVSGAISFSNIKGMSIPGRAKFPKTINHLGKVTGATINSFQERNLSDALFPSLDRGGWFCYLLIASEAKSSRGVEVLKGDIYTYPRVMMTASQKNLAAKFLDNDQAATCLRKSWEAQPHACRVSFELHRDGHVELSYDGYDTANEPSFVFEAFSFLKDLVHSHKFHKHDGDAIVVPYPQNGSHDWLTNTIRNIHKSVVSSYRTATTRADIQNAMGRLSYLESLQEIARRRTQPPEPLINTPALRASLESRLATIGECEDQKSVILQIVVPTIFAILGLLIAMIQLTQVPCIRDLTADETCRGNNPNLPFSLQNGAVGLVQHLLAHWFDYAVVVPLVIIGIYVAAYRRPIFGWLSRHWGYGLIGGAQRVIFSIAAASRNWHILITLVVIAAMLGSVLAAYRGFFGSWPSWLIEPLKNQ